MKEFLNKPAVSPTHIELKKKSQAPNTNTFIQKVLKHLCKHNVYGYTTNILIASCCASVHLFVVVVVVVQYAHTTQLTLAARTSPIGSLAQSVISTKKPPTVASNIVSCCCNFWSRIYVIHNIILLLLLPARGSLHAVSSHHIRVCVDYGLKFNQKNLQIKFKYRLHRMQKVGHTTHRHDHIAYHISQRCSVREIFLFFICTSDYLYVSIQLGSIIKIFTVHNARLIMNFIVI